MIQLKQLADFVLIEITPLEGVLDYHKKLLIGLLLGVGNYEINYNIEIRMYNFSRKLVVFFIIFFAQSSLGTKAAQIKEQNLGQNGYRKYEDGLLIQWGYMSPNSMNSTTGEQYVFLSTSFYNDTYTVITTVISSYTSPIVKEIVRKYTSYFITKSIQYGSIAGESYGWFAIGRWKL
jgi:hypothetical protein